MTVFVFGHSFLLDVTVPIDTFFFCCSNGVTMKPLHRSGVNKHHSAKHFRSNIGRTQLANVVAAPMRGGIRL